MLFNSITFAIFLPIVFIFYWFIANKNLKLQNLIIVIASYVFYGWWDWRFLFLIILSSLIDYTIGIQLKKTKNTLLRKSLLWASIIFNVGLLAIFKYFNFFIYNFVAAFSLLGFQINTTSLYVILPVGISFYTFQTLSYTIDVYKKRIAPTNDLVAFLAFVSFFPQLVAGPIERAKNLLPQFFKKRFFYYHEAIDGLRQMLWGLFKKMVIADNSAEIVNLIFNNSDHAYGSTLLLGVIFFSFQIYGDFSGYSDIAIGTAKLFGFKLMQNFAFPYFSRDVAEFWRRWHISLSTWFRDYIYIPLGGSRGNLKTKIRNTFIIFLVSGFWHGASWNFIIWGFINGLYFMPLLLKNKHRDYLEIVAATKKLPSLKELLLILKTFTLITLSWIFFRAKDMPHAIIYIKGIFSTSLFYLPQIIPIPLLIILAIFIVIEWAGRKENYPLANLENKWWLLKYSVIRYFLYYSLILSILAFGGKEQEFIYFQF